MESDRECALLREYRPWLRTTARSMLHGDELRYAEDLAQEGWIAMFWAIEENDWTTPLDYWLKLNARRRMQTCRRDWFTTGQSRADHSIVEEDVDREITAGQLELAYHYGEIHAALNALSPREREYVYLQFWRYAGPTGKGYPNPLITQSFNRSNADKTWRSARAKLAERLEHLRGCVE